MLTKVHSGALGLAAAWLLVLSTFLPQTQAISLAQGPPPETWPDRRAAEPFEDVPHLASGEPSPEASPAGAVSAVPAWSRLVFQSLRDGNWEIYVANADGSNQVRLTYGTGSDVYPRLNRGCTRIVFASNRSGSYEIYTMNLNGSGVTRLTSNDSHDVRPSWSSDGTRIAFEAYRNGQGEIYVMNADGSNQKRLTQNSVWDGEPVWSPDGSQIAFTSYRNSVYRIWRMNTDGSNQVRLSDHPYSEHPVWSPTGGKIAFDADANGDGWQELWTMNPDGSGESQQYDPPEGQTDAQVGSWSADGHYVAFARVSWIYHSGNWYWTTSYLDAWDSQSGAVVRLSSQGEDMYPDWQTADLAPPISSVSALPSQSPSPISVSWSGQDSGSSGIASYDVQVRDGAGGSWTNWLLGTGGMSAAYSGVGGHTYYFRSRARDNAGNVEAWPPGADAFTMVEARAPATAVNALAPYWRGEVMVRWGGTDPGGSGIAAYDVQVRDGAAGAWTDWQAATGDVQAGFSGEAGHTIYFRSRGTDRAGNVEPWPPGDGDASTTVYAWRVAGTLRDNRETPVMGGVVSLSPEAFATIPSDVDGGYAGYEATASAVYTATWGKAGYGTLPATALSGNTDVQIDIVLPPAGNVVQNWGFETGSLEPEWLVEGEFLPGLTADRLHTGRLVAALGPVTNMLEPWRNLSNTAADSAYPAIGVDDSGAVHVAWHEGTVYPDGDVLYVRREPGGDWSEPESISGSHPSDESGHGPRLGIHSDGTVHVAWMADHYNAKVFHRYRSPDGTWSDPFEASQGRVIDESLGMAVSVDGAVHLIWRGGSEVLYARRAPEGAWSAVDSVSDSAGVYASPQLAVAPDATVHVIWHENIAGNTEILYARRGYDGTWSSPRNLSNSSEPSGGAVLAAAGDGSMHISWVDAVDANTDSILYGHRSAGGTWSDPELVAQAYVLSGPQMGVAPDGSVHLAWPVGGHVVWYARRGGDGVWCPLEEIGLGSNPALYVDSTGTLHFLRTEGYGYTDILYARRSAGGAWSDWLNLSNSPAEYSWHPRLVFDRHDGVYIVWENGPYGPHEILYVESARAEQTTDSILSQELTVPAGAAPTLSFWYRLEGNPTPGGAWFAAQVDDGQTNTTVFTADRGGGWTHAWADLSPWAGQAVSLRFLVHQTEGQPAAWGTLDEVSVGAAYPDLWVTQTTMTPFVAPGVPVEFTLAYGNRGGVGASQVVLTDMLPPELPFLSADPPPTTITPYLTWSVGDLPAGSGPATITLIAGPAPETGVLTNTVEIGSASPELETLNNQAQAQLLIGWRILLPFIVRGY